MYTRTNYQLKKELLADFKAGKTIETFSPGMFGSQQNGTCCIEGPHYPKPHKWYATATIKDGIIIGVK